MKKIFSLFLLFCALVIGAVYFFAAPKAEQKIITSLENLGINHARIEKSSIKINGLTIDKITLDKDGFNEIQNLGINLHWLRFLKNGQIGSVTIKNLKISSTTRELRRRVSKLKSFKINEINQTPISNISIENITLNVATAEKALRFTGGLKINKKDNERIVKARLNAEQYDLAFTSQWEGKITEDNHINLDGKFEELKINNNFIRINRGDGWVSYISTEEADNFSGQIDAGSGMILNVPAKNISLVLAKEKETYPILLRAEAAGSDNVFLTADYTYAHDVAKRDFKGTLKITDLNYFIKELQVKNLISDNKAFDGLKDVKSLYTSIDYMPEKRFAGGPFPFDINIKERLKGTFLIYPDSFDVRGTLETKNNFLEVLDTLFSIPEENIVESTIRIDSNLESLIN